MSFADEFEWAPADEAAVRYSSVKYATQKLVTNIGSRLQSVKAHCQRLQRLVSARPTDLAAVWASARSPSTHPGSARRAAHPCLCVSWPLRSVAGTPSPRR